jgi:transposase InsO family protein
MTKKVPYQSNQEDEATRLRNQAVDFYLAGKKLTWIAGHLGRSRNWVSEALNRFRQGGRAALVSRSRAPQRVHNRTAAKVEEVIVRIRQTITSGQDPELRYAHIGPELIASELERIELTPPSKRTISRILQRHGLTKPRRRKGEKLALPVDYPWPCVTSPNQLHLFDFVTRTAGGQRFYGCHLLDQARRWPYLDTITNKTTAAVADFLVDAWQIIGLPQALYLDNDVVWRGSSSGVRTFSRIVRLCLLLGIAVIFTPPYTPKANPFIESFNATWDENFWQRTQFRDLAHVQAELPLFERYCRHRRPLPELGNCTADRLFPDFQPALLAADFALHHQAALPLTAGLIHFIRFVTADGSISLLNESWSLPSDQWAGKTIRATIDTQAQQLSLFHQAQAQQKPVLVKQLAYPFQEKVLPLAVQFQREKTPLWPASD